MNIAVFLPNWIGDVVMATPALRALRSHYRSARLIGVLKPYVGGVLEGSTWFDELLPAHGGPWSQGVAAVAWKLRQRSIDLAVLLPNSFRVAWTAWLGGCKERVGYNRYGRGPLLTAALPPEREFGQIRISPILDSYNRLVEHLGCPYPGRDMELFTTPADEELTDRVWEQARLSSFPEVVCLNPGAAFGSAKHWPTDYFAQLARDLVRQRGCGVLVLCGPAERGIAREIASRVGDPAVRALVDVVEELPATAERGKPGLSIGLTKACVRRCDLLVTTDSGPRHFAAAFDRPVVTLFGPTHIAWTETYHPRALHLQKPVDCGPCQRRVCPLDHRCMRDLTPDEVLRASETLLR